MKIETKSAKFKTSRFSHGKNGRGHLGMMPVKIVVMVNFRLFACKEQNKTIHRLVPIRAENQQFSCITDQTDV